MRVYTKTLSVTLLLLFSIVFHLSAQHYDLFIHSGQVLPEEGVRFRLDADQVVDGHFYCILQFYDVPNGAVRKDIEDAHIELLDYIPNYAWLARVPEGVDLNNLPIRSVIELSPEVKLAPELQAESYAQCLIEQGGIRVKTLLFPEISKQSSWKMIQNAGFEVRDFQNAAVDMIVEQHKLTELASLPVVMAVVPQECDPEAEGIKGRTLARANLSFVGNLLTGAGVPIGIADDGSVTHEDFRGRVTDFTTTDVGTHGDMTAGIAGGCGNISQKGVGMATGADLFLFDIDGNPHFVDAVPNYITYGIEITSTSYGEGCGGYYTYTAEEIDQQIFDNNTFFHCFSAGNRGLDGCNEVYGIFADEDMTRYGNITGGRKAGKNTIAVGNVHYNDSLRVTSSCGPTHDGRIKPDIVAPGQGNLSTGQNNTYQVGGGTSAASPVIAGSAAMMYEAYQQQYDGNSPASGLIKAMMLCSAEDLGRRGPDYEHGWGRIHLERALEVLEEEQFLTESIEHAHQDFHQIIIPEQIGQARIMVYWTDPAGSTMASKALVNDIDISLQGGEGQFYLPSVLSHAAHYDSLTLPAYPGYDHVNNMEEIIIDNPQAGAYTLRVKGHLIPEGPQEYHVVYAFVKDEIKVTYPFEGEGFIPGQKEIIRWDAWGVEGTFQIEYSLDSMQTWETIVADHPGHLRYYSWNVPMDITGDAFVRVSRGEDVAYSQGNFTIIGVPAFDFDYVNDNTALISWYPVPGANTYEVYAIGEKFMELIGQTNGTSLLFPVELWESNWYSVRAVIDENSKGIRADAKQYTHQTCNANFGLNLQFDLYPGEISWEVLNTDGEVVASGGPYDYLPPNSYLEIQKCLPFGCYTLKIRDAYGDGICCNSGDGYYEFLGQDGNVLTSGGDFGAIKTIYFCLENTEGDLSLNVTSEEHVSCFDGNDGAITVKALGGTGNYTYLWSNGATGANVTGLSAGLHSVTVVDGNSQLSTSVIITQPQPININITPVDINCSTITAGSVLTEVTGGLPPYNYFWNTGASTPDINDLQAGIYKVSVVDANGCLESGQAMVYQNNNLELTTTVVSPSCFGAANGVILASTTGGAGIYEYVWSTGATTPTVFGLAAGDYQVSVSDANGCHGVKYVTMDEPELLEVEGIVSDAGCEGGNSGSIELFVQGGNMPYNYIWNTGQTSYNINNISAGDYSVTVTDINNCTQQMDFDVNMGSPMQLNFSSVSALEGNDGSVDLEVAQGIPPYEYIWSNGATTQDLENLAAGLYNVTVTDVSGCQVTGEVNVGGGEYCLLRGSNTNYEWIERVSWAGESVVTGKNGGLGLYTGTIFQATAGGTYSMEAEPGFSATAFGEFWRVWIDFNGDYDFTDEGEEIYAGGAIQGILALQVAIPEDAVTGITRMRIAMKYGTLPPVCGTYGYGEVEEYGIHIQSVDGFSAAVNHEALSVLSEEKIEKTGAKAGLNIYPNPAADFINIAVEELDLGDLVDGFIYSLDGRQVGAFLWELSGSERIKQIPVNNLPEGVYRLELYGNNSVQMSRFVVNR